MSEYTFILKQGDIELVFSTSDHAFMTRQMDKWIADIAALPDTGNKKDSKKTKSVLTQQKEAEPAEKVLTSVKEAKNAKPKIIKAEMIEVPENIAVKPQQVIEPEVVQVKEDIVEAREYKSGFKKPQIEELELDEAAVKPEPQLNNNDKDKFLEVLQEKFDEIPEIVDKKIAKANEIAEYNLDELINLKKPESLFDFLIVTIYYLKYFERLNRYSLKQINAKCLPFAKKPINHSIIQESVELGYLEVVPDYTGMADVTEYTLTQAGENYLINVM